MKRLLLEAVSKLNCQLADMGIPMISGIVRMAMIPLLAIALCVALGCQEKRETEEKMPMAAVEYNSVLMIQFDASGSFIELLKKKGFPFCEKAIENFYRDRLGDGRDLIIIGQITGGVKRSLLWKGSPQDFRSSFKSSRDFQNFVLAGADTNGSRVHGGVNDALSYLLNMKGVKEGRTHTALLVASDFEDNDPRGEDEKTKLLGLLAEYSKTKGCVGFYWLDEPYFTFWQAAVPKTGMKNYVVEDRIDVNPRIPRWSE